MVESNIKELLIELEKTVGEPIVVKLLVKKGRVSFVACSTKNFNLEEPDDDDEGTPNIEPLTVQQEAALKNNRDVWYIT